MIKEFIRKEIEQREKNMLHYKNNWDNAVMQEHGELRKKYKDKYLKAKESYYEMFNSAMKYNLIGG